MDPKIAQDLHQLISDTLAHLGTLANQLNAEVAAEVVKLQERAANVGMAIAASAEAPKA